MIKESDNCYDKSEILYNKQHNIEDMDTVFMRKSCLKYVNQRIQLDNIVVKDVFTLSSLSIEVAEFIAVMGQRGITFDEQALGFLTKSWDMLGGDLSGGDRQFISILSSIFSNCSLIIMDEPTSNLDKNRIAWFKSVLPIVKKDKIIVIITHELAISDIFDKTVALQRN